MKRRQFFGDQLKRREFITLLGGAAAAWPLAARAQQPAMPVVGFLAPGTPETQALSVLAFRQGLNEAGFVEGRNVTIEFRWARYQFDQLPLLATELVHRQVTVIYALASVSAQAAKAATATIPIVFISGDDPVRAGLVASLGRPGGNVTGVSVLAGGLGTKRLGLLRELVPAARVIGLLVNPRNPNTAADAKDVERAAHAIGQQIVVLNASAESEFPAAFAALVQQRVEALVIGADVLFTTHRQQLVALATRHTIPTIYQWREFATAGGLMSYGTNLADAYRQVGVYVGRILNGAKPADLPVVQPTKFELVINLKTAKALGLDVPPTLLARADEVIE
jgi:putative tryptophan/tyrosine transport system substrate-binding protein